MNNEEYTPIRLDVNVGSPIQRHALMAFLLTLEEVAVADDEDPPLICTCAVELEDLPLLDFETWRTNEPTACNNAACTSCREDYNRYLGLGSD